jgi:hypothetical protein
VTRVHIASGVVEVEASGATAEKLAEVAAWLWEQTQPAKPAAEVEPQAPPPVFGEPGQLLSAERADPSTVDSVTTQDIGRVGFRAADHDIRTVNREATA